MHEYAKEASPLRRLVEQLIYAVAAPAAFILLWWIAAAATESLLLPPPAEVGRRFLELALPTLLPHAGASLLRVVTALAAATAAALPLGILLGLVTPARRFVSPLVYLL